MRLHILDLRLLLSSLLNLTQIQPCSVLCNTTPSTYRGHPIASSTTPAHCTRDYTAGEFFFRPYIRTAISRIHPPLCDLAKTTPETMWILDFASKLGFFISYVLTFFLVLEVVRLACTDVTKREAERLLDAYTRGREQEKKHVQSYTLPVEELEREIEAHSVVNEPVQLPHTPPRRTHTTGLRRTPTSERTLVSEEKEKRKRSQTPTRRLRKRSDTLTSTGSAESRHSVRSKSSRDSSEPSRSSRSHRDSSPESSTSKSSSRHASPGFRRVKDAQGASLSLHRLLRQKV